MSVDTEEPEKPKYYIEEVGDLWYIVKDAKAYIGYPGESICTLIATNNPDFTDLLDENQAFIIQGRYSRKIEPWEIVKYKMLK